MLLLYNDALEEGTKNTSEVPLSGTGEGIPICSTVGIGLGWDCPSVRFGTKLIFSVGKIVPSPDRMISVGLTESFQ